jgi:hypothetical protein
MDSSIRHGLPELAATDRHIPDLIPKFVRPFCRGIGHLRAQSDSPFGVYCVEKPGSDLKVNWPRNFLAGFFVGRVLFCSGQLATILCGAGITSASVLLGISHLAICLGF